MSTGERNNGNAYRDCALPEWEGVRLDLGEHRVQTGDTPFPEPVRQRFGPMLGACNTILSVHS
jgi:hypothetical protein